ncbi:hypothetical protein [Streptomyces nodosus]|uniref:Uncharacterized protein n=1 Tax=Streptomyces nodosus TaxID=40318 RepID=A0A0B5DWC5_9ACTN|nr:hypothetical protein [Streptomyces nodosus]AJE44542.1 Hypothetical protein SNOD_29465 [Streptomyces nodosus]MBB4795187.1 hypothetical protein [Streptomyces nodosus]QEV42188.1 hypothetical protein CP978_29765 [Streptomyces nodosus]
MIHGFKDTTDTVRTTTTEPTECEGTACLRSVAAGRAPELAVAGSRLCPNCRLRLTHDLRRLPRLHDECGQLLTGVDRPRDRTSGGGSVPGLSFNTAAAEARSGITGILRSWAALVVEERGVGAPQDTPAQIADFLLRHSAWLLAHRAAGELSDEVARCVRRARRVVDPAPRRRVPVGDCVVPGCGGALTAAVRPGGDALAVEVGCDTEPAHRWSGQEWMRRSGRPGTERTEPAVRWMTARDIAALWGVAPGSVYRRASEDQWRRRAINGRTYYHEQDVQASFGDHA